MELLAADGGDGTAEVVNDDPQAYLVRGVSSEDDGAVQTDAAVRSSLSVPTGDGEPLLTATESEIEDDATAAFRPLPLRSPSRRRISKSLQLVLLRKYVQCAKQLDGVPSRSTTEQLLDQAYDEFYFHGGDVNEPRMGYTAFIKLVRNRRGEVARLHRAGTTQPSHHKKHAKELEEIHSLIAELERVRRREQSRDSSSRGSDPLAMATPQDTGDSVPTTNTIMVQGEEYVLVPTRTLQAMLQAAQETMETQAKLLDQVRLLEQQLQEMRSHYPLGH